MVFSASLVAALVALSSSSSLLVSADISPAARAAFTHALGGAQQQLVHTTDPAVGVGKALVTILLGDNDVQKSNFDWRSCQIQNIGDKRIVAVYINVADAMIPDIVFDHDGSGGDDVAKKLAHDWGSTETKPISIDKYQWKWQPARSDAAFVATQPFDANQLDDVNNLFVNELAETEAGAAGGFRGQLILFEEFDAGEEYEFSGDMDPNSLAGLLQGTAADHAEWDVGGVSGAEMINSVVTVLFGDGSTAFGTIASDGSQAGGIAVIGGDSVEAPVVRVNGIAAGDSGSFRTAPSVIVSSKPGDKVRVSKMTAFDPVDNQKALAKGKITTEALVMARLQAQYPTFPVNNAKEWQHVDVVIPASGSLDVSDKFKTDEDYPMAFTAVVVDASGLPISMTTKPIRLVPDLLINEWRMDEPSWSGTLNEVKSDVNGIDGTAKNDAATSSASAAISGSSGTCGYGTFDGKKQFVNIPYQSSLNPDDFTVSLWARVDGNPGTYRSPITSRWENAGNQQGYIIYAAPNNRWQFWTGMGAGWDQLSGPAVANGAWTHLAISFATTSVNGNVRTGIKKLYINGVLAAEKSGNYRPNAVGAVTIGSGGGSGNRYHFNGAIDEVAVYKGALSDSAVRSLSRETHQCAGTTLSIPVGEWLMDETWSAVTDQVTDLSGNGFDGTPKNHPVTSGSAPAISGDPGTCTYGVFLGFQFVNIPYQSSLNPNDFTVSLWARVDDNPGTYRSPITSRWENAGNQQGYIIYAAPNNRWQFWTGTGTGWDQLSGPAVANGAWTHVAISFETSSVNGNVRTGTKKLYINGVLAAQKSGNYRPNAVGAVTIGSGGGSGNRYHFNGAIDEVAVYREALSDSEVQSLSREVHQCPDQTVSPPPRPPTVDSVDLMLVNSHCDDEGIFGGGVLPYYAQELGLKVAALTMVTRNGDGSYPIRSGSVSRVQELRNAVDVYAGQSIGSGSFNNLGHYTTGNIVLMEGGLIDTGCCSSDPGYSWGKVGNTGWGQSSQVSKVTPGFGNLLNIQDGRTAAATIIAREIRRHRPRILVTVHDLEGDYGHSNHAATAIGVVDAYDLAADPNVDIDGLPAWRPEKLYLRGSPNDNRFNGANPNAGTINWYGFTPSLALHGHFHDFMELPGINGESARQVAEDGVDQHFSQSSLTDVASVFKPNSRFDKHYSEWWTLYRSTTGGDLLSSFTVSGDLTGTTYSNWSRGDFL